MNNPMAGTDPTGYAIEKRKIKVDQAGSRLKATVTVTTDTETGDTTISGGNYDARKAVEKDITNAYNATAPSSQPASIGAQDAVAKKTPTLGSSNLSSGFEKTNQHIEFEYDTPGIEKVTQSKLTPEEEEYRRGLTSNIEYNADHLPKNEQSNAIARTKAMVNNFALTDEGSRLLRVYSSKKILISIIDSGSSSHSHTLVQGRHKVQFNIAHYGYERAVGENTFVDRSGLRTLSHELHHALIGHRYRSIYTETEASRGANVIMKQHYMRLGIPNQSGVGNYYGIGITKSDLPRGAVIKEGQGAFFL